MDPFLLLTDVELEAAIRDLGQALASGAQQISSPDAGQVGYQSRADAMRTMKALQRSYFKRRGVAFAPDRIRYTTVNVMRTGS